MQTDWFTTSKEGLEKMARERGAARVIVELIANSLDEPGVRHICLDLRASDKAPGLTELIVTDDSEKGFHRLADAYTLFAESYKRRNPEQRGRFNFGRLPAFFLRK